MRAGFALMATYEFAVVITIILAAITGYHAPDIGTAIFEYFDFF